MGLFNSKEFEYADIKVNMLGIELTGLRAITYKKKQDKELVYGQGNNPKAIQRKNKSYEGSLMVLKSDYDLLDNAAIAAGYEDLVDVPSELITATIVYQKEGTLQLSTDVLIGMEFTETEDGMKQGDPFKEVSLPFIFLRKTKS